MRTYGADEVKKILEKLAGDGFVHGSDDGYGFTWLIPDDPADPDGPRHEEYFQYDVEAEVIVRDLGAIADGGAGLINPDDVDDAEDFLDELLEES